jgi:hypothetical protein
MRKDGHLLPRQQREATELAEMVVVARAADEQSR